MLQSTKHRSPKIHIFFSVSFQFKSIWCPQRPLKHPRCTAEKDGFLFPNYANKCKSFFKCHAGYAIQNSCGQDLLFNEQTNYCDWEYNVKCRKPDSGSSGGGVGGGDGDGDGGTDDGNDGQYKKPVRIVCLRSLFSTHFWPFQSCAGLADGTMFANHQSGCKSYFICHHGQYFESQCDKRLLFNENIRSCDWPKNVKCSCHGQCIGDSDRLPHPVYTNRPPTDGPAISKPIAEPHPSKVNCNDDISVRVPKCPPQPCPPVNCVLQACIPREEFYKNYNKL